MNSEIKDRLREAAETVGGLRRLSEKSGIVERTIANWVAGTSEPKALGMAAVAKATGVSLDWLIAGKGPMRPGAARAGGAATFPSVPRYNVSASAGNGRFADNPEILDQIPFTADFLNKRLGRTNTDGLIAIEAVGDSMEPIISDGDLIMIDTHKTMVVSGVYAFTYDDAVYVKRLNPSPGTLTVMSDNKTYDPFTITKEQMNDVKIIGKVVWVGHML